LARPYLSPRAEAKNKDRLKSRSVT
jgi:hypothetical protein